MARSTVARQQALAVTVLFGTVALFGWTLFLPAQGVSLQPVPADQAKTIYGGAEEPKCNIMSSASILMCAGGTPDKCFVGPAPSCAQPGNWVESPDPGGIKQKVKATHKSTCMYYCPFTTKWTQCGSMTVIDEYCNPSS